MFGGAFKSCLQDFQRVGAVGGKVRRCLSRLSLEGETRGWWVLTLYFVCSYCIILIFLRRDLSKSHLVLLVKITEDRLLREERDFKEELKQFTTLLSIAFAFCQKILNTYLCG